MNKKDLILITGASGFSGHHMVMEAVKAGYRVRATDLSSRFYGAMFEALDVEFVKSDLTKKDGMDRLLDGVSAVIHVAGIHNYSMPDKVMFAINVGGVENLCEAAVKAGVKKFVHWSSVGVYGYDWHTGESVAEDAKMQTPPLNNYNITKYQGEQVVWKYLKAYDLKTTILRPAAIYGIRSEYGLYNVYSQIFTDRNKKKNLMVGAGDKIEAFVHIEDMCLASIYALENTKMEGEAYNISDDTRITTAEFFNIVSQELLGTEKPFLHIPIGLLKPVAILSKLVSRIFRVKTVIEGPTLQYLAFNKNWDNTKLKKAGFKFKYPTIDRGIKETLQWYKENGWF